MPFFEDIDSDDEVLRQPIWGAFALIKDNLERLIAANIGWALQLLPLIAAFAFEAIPLILRVVLALYSVVAFIPATAVLYKLMARVTQYEALRLSVVKEDLRELTMPALFALLPLFAAIGLLFGLIQVVAILNIMSLDVLVRFSLIVLFISTIYYIPLFIEYPTRSPLQLWRQSALLVWRYPTRTMMTTGVVLLATIVGTISVGGLFLIVPVVVALLQTRRCYELMAYEHRRQQKIQTQGSR